MANARTTCECQYTLTLTDKRVKGQVSEMKDNFNHVPSMHTINEVQQDYHSEELNTEDSCTIDVESRNTQDDEFAYNSESFYSDASSDELETGNSTLQLADDFSCTSKEEDLKHKITSQISDIRIGTKESQQETEKGIFISPTYRPSSDLIERKQHTPPRDQKNKKKNMTFTDDEVRRIEYENQLLLRKIMAQQKPREKISADVRAQNKTCSSAINRKRLQKKIDYDNMLLLRRIQQARSCVMTTARKPGSRLTFF